MDGKKIGIIVGAVVIIALLIFFILGFLGKNNNGGRLVIDYPEVSKNALYDERIFDSEHMHEVSITIAKDDWKDLVANPLDKTNYKVKISIDGETFENVAFRTKGNSSLKNIAEGPSGGPASTRFSYQVDFDKYDKKQTYFGLDTLNLNNVFGDATYLNDHISYYLFRKMGVPAPLDSYVYLKINNRPIGIYSAVEEVSESFLKRNNLDGNLYKPEQTNGKNYGASLAYRGDKTTNYSDIFSNSKTDITMETRFKKPLSGIIPPLVTPLKNNETLDVESLERLIEHLIEGGVHGLFVLGTTGEEQSLSYDVRKQMIKESCRINRGRLPLLACITDTSIEESIRLARKAADYGADGVVSAPPYYFATGQPELAQFYEELVPQLPLPVFLYNMPSHVKVSFAPDTVARIAKNVQVVGFKDSSANAVYFQSVMYKMQHRPDFAMLVGPEEITGECVLLGAQGGINGGANMFPELYVAMYNAASARDINRVLELQQLIMQISTTIYTVGRHGSSYLKGLKCALSLLGIINDDFVASPFYKFEAPEREKIRQALDALPIKNGKLCI